MPTLILFRHAKSSWDDPDLDDFDRPLARRGAKDAPDMGRWLAREGHVPELVLCSTAVRTRATLALLLPCFTPAPARIVNEDELYLAPAETIIARVAAIEPDVGTAMILAHNPGLHAAALSLAGSGRRRHLAALATGFPTAAAAVLHLPAWPEAVPGAAELRDYMCPKRLD